MKLDAGITPTGAARDECLWAYFNHFVTPKSETSTHYSWSVSWPFKLQEEIDKAIDKTVKPSFIDEDVPIIEQVEVMMGGKEFDEMSSALLTVDSGAL